MSPRRRVIEVSAGFAVTDDSSGFTTTDRDLAAAVAQELDRVDPLPCPEHGDWIEIVTFERSPDDYDVICGRCGHMLTTEERDGETS